MLILPTRAERRDLTDVAAEMSAAKETAEAAATAKKAREETKARAMATATAERKKKLEADTKKRREKARGHVDNKTDVSLIAHTRRDCNQYELQREANIARNKARMATMIPALKTRQFASGGGGRRSAAKVSFYSVCSLTGSPTCMNNFVCFRWRRRSAERQRSSTPTPSPSPSRSLSMTMRPLRATRPPTRQRAAIGTPVLDGTSRRPRGSARACSAAAPAMAANPPIAPSLSATMNPARRPKPRWMSTMSRASYATSPSAGKFMFIFVRAISMTSCFVNSDDVFILCDVCDNGGHLACFGYKKVTLFLIRIWEFTSISNSRIFKGAQGELVLQ